MEKNNKIVFGLIALVFVLALVINGFGDTTGAFKLKRINPDPDLQITEVDITSEDITVTIYNNGARTTTSFITAFYQKNIAGYWEPIGSRYSNDLSDEKAITFTYTWDEALKSDDIKVIVDRDSKVKETNENNNARCFKSNIEYDCE